MNAARGRALLVGVEAYETGSAWNLAGPVHDTLRYVEWLGGLGVPHDRVTLLLSPLPESRDALDDTGLEYRPATRAAVHRALFREIAADRDEWLFIAWSGHGLVDTGGHRRLLYADATPKDLRCLDVEAALGVYRSDLVPSYPRQLWLIDACQTFTDPARHGGVLPPDPVPVGRPRQQPDQHVLFACGPGESAVTRAAGTGTGTRRAGVFSTEVWGLLRARPELRYDGDRLATQVQEQLASSAQRDAGAGHIPTSLWFQGAGRQWRSESPAPALFAEQRPGPGHVPAHRGRATPTDRRRFYEALAAVPVMQDPETRAAVIKQLPAAIAGSIARSSMMRVEILEVMRTCLDFHGGLNHLWDALSLLDPGTDALSALSEVLLEYPQWFEPPGPGAR